MYKSLLKRSTSILIYSLCLVFSSCSHPKESKIKFDGEWMLEAKRINVSQTDLGLYCISDTLYSIAEDACLETLGKFQIHNDTMIIKNYDRRIRDLKYIITKHTNDSLILLVNGRKREYHSRRLDYNDKLHYSRITITIGSYSPVIVKLDSSGNIQTEKRMDKTKLIKKTFKLNSEELNMIDSLFKLSCLDITNTEDWSSGYDGWRKSMKFEYNNKIRTIKTNGFTMPYRINPIFYRITKAVAERKAI